MTAFIVILSILAYIFIGILTYKIAVKKDIGRDVDGDYFTAGLVSIFWPIGLPIYGVWLLATSIVDAM
jgi:hypothetical protein